MPPNPAPLSNAPTRPVPAREKAASGPGSSRKPSTAAASANPVVKEGVLLAGAPAKESQPAAAPQRLPQIGERRRRVIEEHHAEVAQHHVEYPGPERVQLGVGNLEPGVSDASTGGEPTRFGYLDPGKVRAQSMPVAGGARREDGRITAAAADVENVLPVLDLRGGEQPRRESAPHPLMPLTLLDELPPARPVPVLGLLHIHRHERHAT